MKKLLSTALAAVPYPGTYAAGIEAISATTPVNLAISAPLH